MKNFMDDDEMQELKNSLRLPRATQGLSERLWRGTASLFLFDDSQLFFAHRVCQSLLRTAKRCFASKRILAQYGLDVSWGETAC